MTYVPPQVTVTKTADSPTVIAGQDAGFTVKITNTSSTAQATSVTLNDPLPAGLGNNIDWSIDTTGTGLGAGTSPADFTISGSAGNQDLVLSSSFLKSDVLAAGQSISLHITGLTYSDDVSNTCTTQCSIPNNFNGTSLPGGDFIWFNCALNATGLSTSQSTPICFTDQTISFNCGSQSYTVPVPNSCITFSPSCSTATTAFDTGSDCWVTNSPEGLPGNEFICGVPFQVPSGGLSGGIQNVTWAGSCSTNANVGANLLWGAACYSIFTGNCSSIDVKPCDSNAASQYKDSDHCGSPENFLGYVTGGACGGGGSNYTGSYSGTCPVKPSNGCSGTGTLTNIATVSAMCQSPVCASATVTIESAVTISGTKYNDLTGNGFSRDDTPQNGVTIDLYMETNGTSGLQTGSGGDTLVATTTTGNNGAYSFTGLAAGTTYYVQEVVPTGNGQTYVQTGGGPNGAAGSTYYTICTAAGGAYTGNNFDDYLVPTCSPTNVSYLVNNKAVPNLSGNTQQGDTVTVTFTVNMPETLTLVSYTAPTATFSDSNAYQQVIYQQAPGSFTSGTHTLTVVIPNGYYQIDFVCGLAISQLEPNQNNDAYGPDSANILYHAQDRFISGDNGGTQANGPIVHSSAVQVPAPSADEIVLKAAGKGTPNSGGSQSLLPPGQQLSPRVYSVYVDTSKGSVTAAEHAQIDAALAALNAELKSVGVSFVEESTYHGTSSEIAIHVAATTDAGGVAQGVLGVEESGNNITMVSGWNWYTGSNPSKIGAKQYDFETAVFQELGHAAGLGQSTDPSSAMYPTLAMGQSHRQLSAADLTLIQQAHDAALAALA
jgi:uncharacterized repeat protein (TIGR01451 family)